MYERKIWDSIAQHYGRVYDLEAKGREIVAYFVTKYSVSGSLVEVGCGNGLFLAQLKKQGYRGKIIGVDFSMAMITQAKNYIDKEDLLILAKVENLPLKDSAYDVVVAVNLVVNLPSLESVRSLISECKRILKVGGLLFLEFRNLYNPNMRYQCFKKRRRKISHPYIAYSFPTINALLKENSFVVLTRLPIYPSLKDSRLPKLIYKLYSMIFYTRIFAPHICVVAKKYERFF